MCEWASNKHPTPRILTPPPRLIFLDPPLTTRRNTQTHKTIRCMQQQEQQQQQQQQQISVIRTKRKTIQYHTTLYRHKTKQYIFVQQQQE